jgi:hypothetical protein
MAQLNTPISIVITDAPVATPPDGHFSMFARSDGSIWVIRSDGTQEQINVG